jgi:hypothetical protein
MNMWDDVLNDWENGIPLKYPKGLKRFQWNTSVLKKGVPFKQSFKEDLWLAQNQDFSAFQEHIKKSRNKYVVAFPNLSKDSMLVIPMPGKNYATLKDFIDNAPKIQQQEFWKRVAKVAKKFVKENGQAWISTHGLGVDYTHVRIDPYPKYYDLSRTM